MKCKICLEHFNILNKLPMVLSNCGHTFCQSCLLSLKIFACPTCRTIIDGTNKNYELLDIITEKKYFKVSNLTNSEKHIKIKLKLKGDSFLFNKNYKKSIKYFDKILLINQNDLDVNYARGVALFFLEKYDEAIKSFDKVLELNKNYAQACLNKGFSLNKLNNFQESIEVFSRAIRLCPNYDSAYYYKGISLCNHFKLYKRGIQCFNKALRINSKERGFLVAKANVLTQKLNRLDKSLPIYDEIIVCKPFDSESYNNKGLALLSNTELSESINHFDVATYLNPFEYNAYINKGVAYGYSKKFKKSMHSFNQGIRIKSNIPSFYIAKGVVQRKNRRYLDSINNFNVALILDETDIDAVVNKAISLRCLCKYKESLEYFERACSILDQKKNIDELKKNNILLFTNSQIKGLLKVLNLRNKN
jgi:tetratricopeptide (TPR) repeat protein